MAYYIPFLTGYYNPLYNLTNQVFFHCSIAVTFQKVAAFYWSMIAGDIVYIPPWKVYTLW